MDAPWIFNAPWKLIRPWLDPRTVDKLTFASGDVEIKTAFDKFGVPLDIIPSDYGGTAPAVADCPVPNLPGEPDVVVRPPED